MSNALEPPYFSEYASYSFFSFRLISLENMDGERERSILTKMQFVHGFRRTHIMCVCIYICICLQLHVFVFNIWRMLFALHCIPLPMHCVAFLSCGPYLTDISFRRWELFRLALVALIKHVSSMDACVECGCVLFECQSNFTRRLKAYWKFNRWRVYHSTFVQPKLPHSLTFTHILCHMSVQCALCTVNIYMRCTHSNSFVFIPLQCFAMDLWLIKWF